MNAIKPWLATFFTNGRGDAATARARPEEDTPPPQAESPVYDLSLRSSAYIAAVTLVAGALSAFYLPELGRADWHGFLTLIILAVVFERVGLQIYGATHVSAGVVALFAIGILYGPAGAAVASPVVVLAAMVFTRNRWHTVLFTMSTYTLTNVASAVAFHALIDTGGGVTAWWVPTAMLAIAVNYCVNAWLVAVVMSFYAGEPWWMIWREQHQWLFPYFIVFGLLGLALAAAYRALQVPGILAFVAPPLMMRFALHQYVAKTEQTVLELKQTNTELEQANRGILQMTRQLTETYDGTLEALVLALDARDHETKGHSFRVAKYAMAVARELGLEDGSQEWIDMQRGALLHDVGKIGVPDFILHKPGPLTPEEWTDMKRHPHIGNDMLKDISFLAGAAAIVHAHHERFDGKGYPRGLAADEIPMGARIFAVADAFDAMTSDRPYRKALPPEVAWQEVLRHSGTQFDPRVVQAFLAVFDGLCKLGTHENHEYERAA